jgi:hypothetical protein
LAIESEDAMRSLFDHLVSENTVALINDYPRYDWPRWGPRRGHEDG